MKKFAKFPAGIPQQLYPLGTLFIVGLIGLGVVRHFLVPKTFGDYGHYRAQAVIDNASHELAYAGHEACADCHDDIVGRKAQSEHAGVACEACHGPGEAHTQDPTEVTLPAPRQRAYCPLCHGYDPARPTGFPQILPTMHNPGHPCITCHDPHNPVLSHAPEECSACHRVIANDKAVSHHASLPCTQCHEVPDKHKVTPLLVRAQKPASRAVCGRCHDRNADSPRGIPRIDLATHGGNYMCWECHYPHLPEVQ